MLVLGIENNQDVLLAIRNRAPFANSNPLISQQQLLRFFSSTLVGKDHCIASEKVCRPCLLTHTYYRRLLNSSVVPFFFEQSYQLHSLRIIMTMIMTMTMIMAMIMIMIMIMMMIMIMIMIMIVIMIMVMIIE